MGEGRWNVPQDGDDDNRDEGTNLAHSNNGGVGGGDLPTHVVGVQIAKDSLNGDLRGKIQLEEDVDDGGVDGGVLLCLIGGEAPTHVRMPDSGQIRPECFPVCYGSRVPARRKGGTSGMLRLDSAGIWPEQESCPEFRHP